MNKKKISIISTIVIIGVGALSYTAYAQYQKKSKINTFKTDLESFQQKTKNSIMSKDENSEVNSLISECNKIVDTSNINAIPEMENKLNSELNEIKKENETLIANQIKEVSSLNTSKLSDKDDITKKLNDIKSLESKGEFASANQELIKLKEHINSENKSIEKKEQEEAKKKVEEEKKKQESQLKENLSTPEKIILRAFNPNEDKKENLFVTPVKLELTQNQKDIDAGYRGLKAINVNNPELSNLNKVPEYTDGISPNPYTYIVSEIPFTNDINDKIRDNTLEVLPGTNSCPMIVTATIYKRKEGGWAINCQNYFFEFSGGNGDRFTFIVMPNGVVYDKDVKSGNLVKIN